MPQQDPLVDADALLALTRELRAVRERIEAAELTEEQRQRWQRTLGGIAEGAAADIQRATAQLRRFSAQVDRSLRSG